MAYNMPMHAYEYVNTVRWFYDNFDHPHMAKLLFVAGSFVNEVYQGQQAFPGNGPRPIRRRVAPAAGRRGRSCRGSTSAFVGLKPDDAST